MKNDRLDRKLLLPLGLLSLSLWLLALSASLGLCAELLTVDTISTPEQSLHNNDEQTFVLSDGDQESSTLFCDQPSDTLQPLGFSTLAITPERSLAIGGQIVGFTAYDLKKESYEDQRLSRLRSRLHVQHDSHLQQGLKLQGRVALEWDLLDSDNSYVGSDNDLNLYEAYLKLRGDSWDFSVGRQRVRWGKSDQLSPLDSINPDDMRQFMTIDLEERKIPSWLARLRLHHSKFSIETIFMPWFEKSELDYFDSDWALYRNLRQIIVDNPQLPQSIKDYARDLGVDEHEPSD